MALKLYERYPQLWESPSNDYPQGAFKNLSAQGETDGSYLEKDWLNDYSGFFGALLKNAQITPDGTIDTAQRSQFYDAFIKVAKKAVSEEGYRKLDDLSYEDGRLLTNKEIINNWDQASDENVFSAGFVSKRINQDADGNTIIRSGVQTFTFPSEGGEIVTDESLIQEPGQDTTKVMSQKAVTDFVSESTPIGTVQAYIGGNVPNDKWLLCRGQAFSAESYPALAQLLPNLKIPDLRGVALRGLDANRGFDPGRKLLSYQEDAMQKIEGSFSVRNVGNAAALVDTTGSFSFGAETSPTSVGSESSPARGANEFHFDSSRVARTATETRMKNVAVNFIIKAR